MKYRFGTYELDLTAHEFRRDGQRIALEPQVFSLLALFVQNQGALVSRDHIINDIWGGRIISDAALSSRINALRRALQDDGKSQAVLETVTRCGFRFLPSVTTVEEVAHPLPLARSAPQRIRVTRSADGTRIAFAVSGTGPPLLRAGHFLTHLDHDRQSPIWQPFLDRLDRQFSTVRYDQRGTGLSDDSATRYDLEALVDDMAAVADSAGIARFPILAASQGVPVSIAYAARHPDRVSSMVLYGGYAQGRAIRGSIEERAMGEAMLSMIRQGWGREPAFADAFTTIFIPDATPAIRAGMVQMQMQSASAENAVALRRAIDGFDVSHLLEQVHIPVLVIHARGDSVHPLSQAKLLAAGLPNADLTVLDSRNHVPLPTDPAWEDLMQAITSFLSQPQ